MSTHKHIDKICLVAALLALILCVVFMNGEALGIRAASKAIGYEERLFDTTRVHTIDIIIDDWDEFLETARSEEYSVCSVIIDGEAISNVGIRGKGNTSLSNVASMDSDRYSFKIEFDQYDSTRTYHGLDKLSLNNIIQDNTYMKDYLSYRMMNEFDVPAPLCSYAYLTVNGEDWGLYLAVEAVEESFLQRSYGSDYGDLYKPDSMDMGGGRGNGKDFEMPDFSNRLEDSGETVPQSAGNNRGGMSMPGSKESGFGRGGFSLDEETIRKAFESLSLDTTALDGIDFENVTMETIQSVLTELDGETMQKLMQAVMGSGGMEVPDMGGFGGMGSSQTKLQYIDDDPASYSTIFESAKTDVTDADQSRLIASLKQLSEYENLEEVLLVEDVLRYFVVHNYVVNGDSYTGSMIHNYYLYEENGKLSMIPWDYNLAFGTFQGGNADSAVNDDIDEVLSDRPMQAWIFSDEAYSRQYYALYAQLLEQVDVQGIIDHAYELIAPYVEKDPTAFCTYEEFQTGVEVLKQFCALRTESVRLQLSGSSETVDTGALNLSDMGTMGGGMGGFGDRGNREDFAAGGFDGTGNADGGFAPNSAPQFEHQNAAVPGGGKMPDNMEIPEFAGLPGGGAETDSVQPGGMEPPSGMQMPEGMQMPGGMEVSGEMQRPGGQSDQTSGNRDPFSGDMPTAESVPMPGQGSGGLQFDDRVNMDASAGSSQSELILLAVSAVVLLAGLIAAKRYRH